MNEHEKQQMRECLNAINAQLKGRKVGKHRWSGWPGAWCLDCGCEDPSEICIGGGEVPDDHPGWKDCLYKDKNLCKKKDKDNNGDG